MSESTPLTSNKGPAADSSPEPTLKQLRAEKRRIARKIRELSKPYIINNIPETTLPTVECLRCGYIWTPYSLDVTPRLCSRCGSPEWMLPPTETSRKPSDPPSSYWRVRKGT